MLPPVFAVAWPMFVTTADCSMTMSGFVSWFGSYPGGRLTFKIASTTCTTWVVERFPMAVASPVVTPVVAVVAPAGDGVALALGEVAEAVPVGAAVPDGAAVEEAVGVPEVGVAPVEVAVDCGAALAVPWAEGALPGGFDTVPPLLLEEVVAAGTGSGGAAAVEPLGAPEAFSPVAPFVALPVGAEPVLLEGAVEPPSVPPAVAPVVVVLPDGGWGPSAAARLSWSAATRTPVTTAKCQNAIQRVLACVDVRLTVVVPLPRESWAAVSSAPSTVARAGGSRLGHSPCLSQGSIELVRCDAAGCRSYSSFAMSQ